MKLVISFLFINLFFMQTATAEKSKTNPVRVGVARLTHTHVHWLLGRPDHGDIEIAGIYEPNRDLALRYLHKHKMDESLLYDDFPKMLKETNPQAVTAFGTIFEHLEVVEVCAPLGIHVMVEKPLAFNLEHAEKMAELASRHNIHLLTNYETTWYPSNHKVYEIVHNQKLLGPLRKIVVHSGHPGPVAIGVNQEFLTWLIDPEQNGGGVLPDFGCYGANLMTWLLKGQEPLSVTCITQQLNPLDYPLVEDEATIVLTYPNAQGIILASWNWPVSRKDMEVYGKTGQAIAKNADTYILDFEDRPAQTSLDLKPLKKPHDDPFALLASVVSNETEISETDLSSLENNMIVMKILEAAKESAKQGKTILLNKAP